MNIETKRHSYSHVLAQAIKHIYGNDVKIWIWPDVENGFYYDFDFNDIEVSDKDLKNIQKEVSSIIKQNQKFIQFSLPVDEAIDLLEDLQEPYKVELAKDLKEKWETEIWFYGNAWKLTDEKIENIQWKKWEYLRLLKEIKNKYNLNKIVWENALMFLDMCAWPHVEETSQLDAKAVKIAKLAGAYWKGDANNKMLTRIYGYAFDTEQELKDYLNFLEEAKKRDHRVLGQKLKIFLISDKVGAGLPLFHPAWMMMRKELEDYLWELHKTRGYERVWTPHLAKEDLYITSGHAGHYLENMFKVYGGTSKETFFLKPMNCPHHMQIFDDNQFSYKDMPIRYFEPATVYRDEKTWQLSGLARVRSITQDDGHLFCRVSQIKDEVKTITDVIREFYTTMGMADNYWVSLSVRGEDKSKYLWTDEVWEKAESALEEACKENNLNYKRVEWEAAFYGPKLDFMFKDAIGRERQLATIQCDFNLPERFNLSFTNENWEKERPVVIHRAIMGSFERLMAMLIEHFAWTFPLWLAPRQTIVIPVADKFIDYAKQVNEKLMQEWFRTQIDLSSDSFSKKIRNAEKMHINYILVVGEKEEKEWTVSVRNYKTKEQSVEKVEEFIERIKEERKNRSL